MSERETPMRAVQVDYKCDACGEADLEFGGITLASYPPQYPHSCPKCDIRKTLLKRYPAIEWRPAE